MRSLPQLKTSLSLWKTQGQNKNLQILILQALTARILGSKLDATPLTPAYFHTKCFSVSY